jgi:hypothetical protein
MVNITVLFVVIYRYLYLSYKLFFEVNLSYKLGQT